MKIKKIIFCVALLSTVLSHSQDVEFGIRGGLNLSSINVDPQLDVTDPDSRIGFHIGGLANIGLNESLSIQPEITLNTLGAKFEEPGEIERIKLTYLSLLGALKYNLNDKLNVLAGPQLSFLSGGEFEEEDIEENTQESLDAKDLYKGTDLSIAFGLGYRLDENFEISAKYNLGLTDNNDDSIDEGFFEPNQKLRNRFFQISLAYFFY